MNKETKVTSEEIKNIFFNRYGIISYSLSQEIRDYVSEVSQPLQTKIEELTKQLERFKNPLGVKAQEYVKAQEPVKEQAEPKEAQAITNEQRSVIDAAVAWQNDELNNEEYYLNDLDYAITIYLTKKQNP